jgi:hypothetical protein
MPFGLSVRLINGFNWTLYVYLRTPFGKPGRRCAHRHTAEHLGTLKRNGQRSIFKINHPDTIDLRLRTGKRAKSGRKNPLIRIKQHDSFATDGVHIKRIWAGGIGTHLMAKFVQCTKATVDHSALAQGFAIPGIHRHCPSRKRYQYRPSAETIRSTVMTTASTIF